MKQALIGVNNLARKTSKIYVGVNGLAKKVLKGYIGVNGLAKEFYSSEAVLIYSKQTAGTETLYLNPGKYQITLIGGGGGGAFLRGSSTGQKHYAQGGVGGTITAVINVAAGTNVSITVGAGSSSAQGTFSGAGTVAQGTNGTQSEISGITNLTSFTAGGGTGAKVQSTSTSGANRIVGVIGSNTATGSAVISIIANNAIAIVSNQSTANSSSTNRTPTGRANDNWPKDTVRGKSGDVGWTGTTNPILMLGAPGLCEIYRL